MRWNRVYEMIIFVLRAGWWERLARQARTSDTLTLCAIKFMDGRIFYADKTILDKINSDFELIDDKAWALLYHDKKDKGYWRLDKPDKYQEQYFVKVDSIKNWDNFDDKELKIQLLKDTRGTENKACIWTNCERPKLKGLVYCERHAFEEMGIRR